MSKSNRKIVIIVSAVAVGMFGFCFAMVPLYSVLCKKIGLNTSVAGSSLITPTASDAISQAADESREVTVQFTATNHLGMPWIFYPDTKSVTVHPGERKKVYFYAKNPTNHEMTSQAIPAMTPPDAISHFHKIECFCFNRQTLKAGESKEMGLIFQIDSELPKEVHVITLAYTLFDVTPKKTSARGNK